MKTILDIASHLGDLDHDWVIFAESMNGAFVPQSRAVVLALSDADLAQPADAVAALRCPGLEYCLEVSIAKDAVKVWSSWRDGRIPLDIEAAEAICHKATFDAWGPPNW